MQQGTDFGAAFYKDEALEKILGSLYSHRVTQLTQFLRRCAPLLDLALKVISHVLDWVHIFGPRWPPKSPDPKVLLMSCHNSCTMRSRIVVLQDPVGQISKGPSRKGQQLSLQQFSITRTRHAAVEHN